MSDFVPAPSLEQEYEKAEQAYLASLPLEHFMESTAQGTQRAITLASMAVLKVRRADMHVFNELLIQYPQRGTDKLGQVVPDNMVVLSSEPVEARGSFNIPFQTARPFWVMEYISPTNMRKDYEDSFKKYERGLKVPYYLLFHPDTEEVILYHHNGRKYVKLKANKHGRHEIPELELELGLWNGWVRYWYQGELLPLPDELQQSLDETRRRLQLEQQRADALQQRVQRVEEEKQALEQELIRLRAQVQESQAQREKSP